MVDSVSSSNFSDLRDNLEKCIHLLISQTWNLQNIREEICLSKSYLNTLEAAMLPYEFKTLVLEYSKIVFNTILEEFTIWTGKKEILRAFDNCLNRMSKTEILNKSYLLSCTNYNIWILYKLIDLISYYGDYDFQALIIKIIIKIFKRDPDLIKELLPESKEFQNKFMKISIQDFDGPVREFLNSANQMGQKIYSIKCQNIIIGSLECMNKNGLWIDFNLIDKIVSWYTDVEVFSSEKSNLDMDNEESFSNLILLFQQDVIKLSHERNLNKTITIVLKLKKSCLSYQQKYQHIIDDARIVKFILNDDLEAEYFQKMFPPIYGRKKLHIPNKRRRLSSMNKSYSTTKSINEATNIQTSYLGSGSLSESFNETQIKTKHVSQLVNLSDDDNSLDINKIIDTKNILKHKDLNIQLTSKDSVIFIDSEKDFHNFKPIVQIDVEDKTTCFNSEELLMKMASEFDGFHAFMDNSCSNVTTRQFKDKTNNTYRTPIHNNIPLIYTSSNSSKDDISTDSKNKICHTLKKYDRKKVFKKKQPFRKLPSGSSYSGELFSRKVNVTRISEKTNSTKNERKRRASENSIDKIEILSVQSTVTSVDKYISFGNKIESKRQPCRVVKKLNLNYTADPLHRTKRKIGKRNYEITFNPCNDSSFQQLFDTRLLIKELNEVKEKYEPHKSTKNKSVKNKKSNKRKSYKVDNVMRAKTEECITDVSFDGNFIIPSEAETPPPRITSRHEDSDFESTSPLVRKLGKPRPIKESTSSDDVEIYEISESNDAPTNQKIENSQSENAVLNEKWDYSNNNTEKNNDVQSCSKNGLDQKIKILSNVIYKEKESEEPHFESRTWSKNALLGETEIVLNSKDFLGKYLFLMFYNFDISSFNLQYCSETTQLNEKIEDFKLLETNILICTKGPNINILKWAKQFQNQKFKENLKIPLIVDFEGDFMSCNFQVEFNCDSPKKMVIILDDRGSLVLKNTYAIFDEVDSLELLRNVQIKKMFI